jgi:micrococcal nuclease
VRPRTLFRQLLFICLLVGLSLLGLEVTQHGSVTAPSGKLVPPGLDPVVRTIDGDTIVVRLAGHEETVRFIGMDTPETHDPRKAVQCFGATAAAETHKLLSGKSVRLEGDPEDSDRDKYHRLLRYIYLPDGTMVNQYLVQHGYAFAYVIFANSKLAQFKAWQTQAQAAKRGLWAVCQTHLDGHIEQTNDVGPPPA